ncbi:MAG: hypothetical protein AAFU50_08670, partial [Pseudomonadota bacterium]
ELQPIDLRVLRHDRREVQRGRADRSCKIRGGRLVCDRGIASKTYDVWIVPEAIAERAGEDGLLDAVSNGLGVGRS